MAHTVIQEALDWKASDGPATLQERGVYQNEEGSDSEVDLPDWDDRVDSLINKPWVERMARAVAGRIEVSVSSIMRTKWY